MNRQALLANHVLTAGEIGGTREAANIAFARVFYAEQCAACHGVNLEGVPGWQRPRMDTSPRRRMTRPAIHRNGDEMLFDFVELGKQAARQSRGLFTSGMSGFSDTLTDVEIEAILAYIRATLLARIRDPGRAHGAGTRKLSSSRQLTIGPSDHDAISRLARQIEHHAAQLERMPAMHEGVMVEDADLACGCGMIAHHQGAIDMAEVLHEHGDDPRMRSLAEDIIAAQVGEIEQMTTWLAENAD